MARLLPSSLAHCEGRGEGRHRLCSVSVSLVRGRVVVEQQALRSVCTRSDLETRQSQFVERAGVKLWHDVPTGRLHSWLTKRRARPATSPLAACCIPARRLGLALEIVSHQTEKPIAVRRAFRHCICLHRIASHRPDCQCQPTVRNAAASPSLHEVLQSPSPTPRPAHASTPSRSRHRLCRCRCCSLHPPPARCTDSLRALRWSYVRTQTSCLAVPLPYLTRLQTGKTSQLPRAPAPIVQHQHGV